MDLLQKELQRKKELLEKAKEGGDSKYGARSKRKKYMRQSDLRRVEEAAETSSKRPKTEAQVAENPVSPNEKPVVQKQPPKSKSLSVKAITRQLRSLGLPVRYFGETQEDRENRLQQALEEQNQTLQGRSEMDEFRLGKGHGIRNQFLEKDDKSANQPTTRHEEEEKDTNDTDDPPKHIYKFLKGLLKEWESDLEERPDSVAKTVTGRTELKTFKQCKDYIRPLFKLLKQRKLEAGLEAHLFHIVQFAQEGEFVKAHDAYMDMAIGRAAWPIGVTMVGIHARSGRAKIESSNVAHVMNSELQRKYLTSVKRLLSFAQKKRPDVDPSKKVG